MEIPVGPGNFRVYLDFYRASSLPWCVHHPGADDDRLWYFDQAGSEFQVQIESPEGMCPFLIETDEDDKRRTGRSVEETVEILARLLHIQK